MSTRDRLDEALRKFGASPRVAPPRSVLAFVPTAKQRTLFDQLGFTRRSMRPSEGCDQQVLRHLFGSDALSGKRFQKQCFTQFVTMSAANGRVLDRDFLVQWCSKCGGPSKFVERDWTENNSEDFPFLSRRGDVFKVDQRYLKCVDV